MAVCSQAARTEWRESFRASRASVVKVSTVSREGNNNYGAVLNVWDHVFRSFFRPDQPFAGPVGIGQLPDFPAGYLAQQLSPFRWRKIRRANPARGLEPA